MDLTQEILECAICEGEACIAKAGYGAYTAEIYGEESRANWFYYKQGLLEILIETMARYNNYNFTNACRPVLCDGVTKVTVYPEKCSTLTEGNICSLIQKVKTICSQLCNK